MSKMGRRTTISKKDDENNMYNKFNSYFFGKDEQYYRDNVADSCCLKFKNMQIIRLILIAITLAVWGAMFYVNVKKCIMYLNFWSLTFTLLYLLTVLPNAGKIVVEKQLLGADKLEEKNISIAWKRSIIYYSIAWPLTVTSCLTFSLFFMRDQVCSTYFDFGFGHWREVIVILATYVPLFVLLVDLFINRVPLSYKHLYMNLVIICVYISINVISQIIQDRPIYGYHFAIRANYDNNFDFSEGNYKDDQWAIKEINDCKNYFGWGTEPSFTIDSKK